MDDKNAEKFLELLVPNQKRIMAFVQTLVPQQADAEDIVQEAIKVLWRKFDGFELGTDFVAWAMRIAYIEVLNYRRYAHTQRQKLSKESLRLLRKDSMNAVTDLDGRMDAVRRCLHKLPPRDFEIIKMRYMEDLPVRSLGQRFGRSVQAIYKSLARIQEILMRCVNRTLYEQGMTA